MMRGFSPALPCPLQPQGQLSSSFGKKRVAAVGGHGSPLLVRVGLRTPKGSSSWPQGQAADGNSPAKEMGTGQCFFAKLLPS